MRKELIHKRNLWQYKTAITDTSNLSPKFFNFTEFPPYLTAGKNAIKLKINPKYMQIGTPIYIEILDSNGELIYYEVLSKLEDDLSRVISVYVYEDTPSGDAQFTILGTAKMGPNGETVNNSTANVKFNKLITVNQNKRNSSEIIYDDGNKPNVEVIERLIPYQEKVYTTGFEVTQSSGQVSYSNGIITATNFNFKKEMISGSIIIANPNNSYPTSNISQTNVTYSATISEIYNATQARVAPFYTISSSRFDKHNFKKFDASDYVLTYNESGSIQTTENKKSYAYVKFNNLQSDTGDVYRIKANFKSDGETKNQWEQIDDIQVFPTNLMIDSSSNNPLLNYGEITNQTTIDNYYKINSIGGETNTSMSFDSSSLFNSIKTTINQVLSSSQYFYIEPTQSLDFYVGHEYTLNYKSYSKTNVSHSGQPLLEVYASGSAFKNNDSVDNLGKYLTLNSQAGDTRYNQTSVDFIPDQSGNGKIIFKIKSGEWYISDITVKSKTENGFTPNQIVGIFNVPTKYRNDKIDLQFEYYNYNNQQSEVKTEIKNLYFTGSNFYIQGNDNLVTGSTHIGTSTSNGMEMFGNQGGGYIRTHGYTNFITESNASGSGGIIMYSGSADYGSEYVGIGMEMFTPDALHGMYFGSYHGMYQRQGSNEMYHQSGSHILNTIPGNGRGDIIYGYVSSSVGRGTPVSLKGDGTWIAAGTHQSGTPEAPISDTFYSAKGIVITSETGSYQPILIRGIFSDVGYSLAPGSIFINDTPGSTGSLAIAPGITYIQKLGAAYSNNVAFFDFLNAPVFSAGTIID